MDCHVLVARLPVQIDCSSNTEGEAGPIGQYLKLTFGDIFVPASGARYELRQPPFVIVGRKPVHMTSRVGAIVRHIVRSDGNVRHVISAAAVIDDNGTIFDSRGQHVFYSVPDVARDSTRN